MRAGLSLRIPGQQELSPDPKTFKCHSASSSVIKVPVHKPPSPIPKSYHHRSSKSSAYSRILSNTSFKKQALPSFLQLSQSTPKKNSKLTSESKPKIAQTSDLTTDTSYMKNEESKQKNEKIEKNPEKFIQKIFTKKLKHEEILLKLGKIELNRGELQTLDPKNDICRSVIDACLKCIRYKNRKLCKQSELCERGFILTTKTAQMIFTSEKPDFIFNRNPLKYELIFFPLYIEYWTLVILNTKQKLLTIFNIQESEIAQEILECIKGFIESQLKKHEKKTLESTTWRELTYNLVQFNTTQHNNGTLLLFLTYKYCLTPSVPLSSDLFVDFRYTLLIMLYRHGIEIN